MLTEIREAVMEISNGRTFFTQAFTDALLARAKNPTSLDKILTSSELTILSLIGLAYTDDEIGTALGITKATAQTHRSSILRKLQIQGTPKLIHFARAETLPTILRLRSSEKLDCKMHICMRADIGDVTARQAFVSRATQ